MKKKLQSDKIPSPIPEDWNQVVTAELKELTIGIPIAWGDSPPLPAGLGLVSSDQIPNFPLPLFGSSSVHSSGTTFLHQALEKSHRSTKIDLQSVLSDISAKLRKKHQEIKTAIKKIPHHGLVDNATVSDIIRILVKMPPNFRHKAFCKYAYGFSRFGKIPVRFSVGKNDKFLSSVAGEARPMGCPEPAPEGSEFILAWHEGDWWNWDLPRNEKESEEMALTEYHGWVSELGKYLYTIKKQEASASEEEVVEAKILQRMLRQSQFGRPLKTDIELGSSHFKAFVAGVKFARSILYKSADSLYEDRDSRGKSDPWPDILRHALDRHGWDTTPKRLEQLLSLNVIKNDKIQRSSLALCSDYPYMPTGDITKSQFSTKIKNIKKRNNPHKLQD